MVAERAEQRAVLLRYPGKTNHEIPPGSMLYVAGPANRFLGEIGDQAPITAIARTDLDSGRRNAAVELVGHGWLEIGATEVQLKKIRELFRNLLFNARDIDTVGKLRQALEDKRIARVSGISEIGQTFLEIATKKHLRVIRPGLRTETSLPSLRPLTPVRMVSSR
jgi:hypothetical protein